MKKILIRISHASDGHARMKSIRIRQITKNCNLFSSQVSMIQTLVLDFRDGCQSASVVDDDEDDDRMFPITFPSRQLLSRICARLANIHSAIRHNMFSFLSYIDRIKLDEYICRLNLTAIQQCIVYHFGHVSHNTLGLPRSATIFCRSEFTISLLNSLLMICNHIYFIRL